MQSEFLWGGCTIAWGEKRIPSRTVCFMPSPSEQCMQYRTGYSVHTGTDTDEWPEPRLPHAYR